MAGEESMLAIGFREIRQQLKTRPIASFLSSACALQLWLIVSLFSVLPKVADAQTSLSYTAASSGRNTSLTMATITPVKRDAAGSGQYDFSYQIKLRNSGAGAYDVRVELSSNDSRYIVQDGRASLELLKAGNTADLTDIVKVRAPASFDTRFNAQGQPMGGSGGASTPAIEGSAFSWRITAQSDGTAPLISSIKPSDSVSSSQRSIEVEARYNDSGVGIAQDSIKLTVNGQDVTRRARVRDDRIEYGAEGLTTGSHFIKLEVADKLGNKSERTWTFNYGSAGGSTTPSAPTQTQPPPTPSSPPVVGGSPLPTSPTGVLPQFLVIDYSPISKTEINESSRGRKQYQYVYRVTVRNSGASAADVSADVASKRSSVFVTDGSVSFGAIDARKTKASTDTFSIKADKYFDRRLDKKITRNGRVEYEDAGDDDDDRATPGLGRHSPAWLADAMNAWYNIKFNAIFSWKIQSRQDASAPVVSSTSPQGIVTSTQPAISANYSDAGGVATSRVNLKLDGVDVTAQATVSTTGISFRPTSPLSQGVHNVTLVVPDNAGNIATATWAFTVDSLPPVVAGQSPKDTNAAASNVIISAQYNDAGSGVDQSKVQILVDGVNVTEQATKSATGISYQNPSRWTAGNHAVILRVADMAGNTAESSWTFGVDAQAPVVSNLQPANAAELGADALPIISASFSDSGIGIDISKAKLLLDGLDVTAQAQISTAGISYRSTAALKEGLHTIKLTVADRNGNDADTQWTFITKTPPEITAVAPKDVLLGAAAQIAITAQYNDIGAGIDANKVKLLLDGVDVTANAQITESGLSFAPSAPLPQGQHIVQLTVTDKAGNSAATSWRFTVDTGLPTISNETPKGTLINTGTPTIGANFQETGDSAIASGIDASKVKLLVNDVDVTAQSQINATSTPGQISYTPSSALSSGAQTVKLSVGDKAGNTVESQWSFMVDSQGPALVITSPAANAVWPADALINIQANFNDGGSGVELSSFLVELDGQNITAQVTANATGANTTLTQALSEGTHTLRISLKDKAGNASSQSVSFRTMSPPVISDISPVNGTAFPNGSAVALVAKFTDIGAGIDPASIRLTLDGTNVTGSATLTVDSITFAPLDPMPQGAHTVTLSVTDRAGNQTVRAWSFEIETAATTAFSDLTPRNVTLASGAKPVISANYSDPSGVSLASVRLVVDEVDVTSQAQVTAQGVSFTPSAALATGRHVAYLRVINNQGRTASTLWSFEVDPPIAYSVGFLEPTENKAFDQPEVSVRVRASSDKYDVTGITVNGQALVRASGGGFEAIYSGKVQVPAGDSALLAIASFADGQTRQISRQVSFAVPPTIKITSPADKSILGAANTTSPRNLTGNVDRPVLITGTVDRPVISVVINQQQAELTDGGRGFRFNNFFLHEGNNMLTAVATDAQGRVGMSSIYVSVDQTAPFLNIESPSEGAVTSASMTDVRGAVNDAVEGYYNAPEPTVTVSSSKGTVTARVADKYFLASSIPLELGENTLTVIATDTAGNARNSQIKITRIAAGSDRITIYSGNNQSGKVGAQLAKPLTIVALNKDGNPIADLPVSFDITRGTGQISAQSGGSTAAAYNARNLTVKTDSTGRASAWLSLGKHSGPASNAVRASHPDIAEEVVFTADGDKQPAKHIRVDMGANQYAATGSQPLEALTAVVIDAFENRIAAADVTFRILIGDAKFEGEGASSDGQSITVKSDKSGYAAVRPRLGTQAGEILVGVSAPGEGETIEGYPMRIIALKATDGATGFRGVVQNDRGQPLPGARVSITRTNLSATTDDKGRFQFDGNVPPGRVDLFIDGRTVNVQAQQYPTLHFEATAVPGVMNELPHPVYLPQLVMSEAKIVGGDQDVVLKMPGYEGYEMIVKANSVIFPDGSRVGPLVVSPIAADKLPMTPPGGYSAFMAPAATLQPSGTRFDPPVQLKLPNTAGLLPGEKKEVFQWDHDLATFVPMGQATVTEDGAFIVTDVGSGITKAGWHPLPNPGPPDGCGGSGGSSGPLSCDTCLKLNYASSGGPCPYVVRVCVYNTGASCDDKKFCTRNDKCDGASCRGEEIKEERKKGDTRGKNLDLGEIVSALGSTNNPSVRKLMSYLSSALASGASLSVEYSEETVKKCCESKESFVEDESKGISGKISKEITIPLPGYSIPIPLADSYIGIALVGAISTSAGGKKETDRCESDTACKYQVEAKVGLEAQVVLGAKGAGIAAAGIFGKTGLEASRSEDSKNGKTRYQFNGLTVGYRVEFPGGFFSETDVNLVPPQYWETPESSAWIGSRIGMPACEN
jgi:Glucodextranase, domain B/Bacterial Ig-like domain